jgi:acetolactate synthase regulatory subunit
MSPFDAAGAVRPAEAAVAPAAPAPVADPARHADHYVISADADPGLLPRVLDLIAKRGLVPAECHAFTRRPAAPGAPARLTVELRVEGLERRTGAHLAACLRGLWPVSSVLHLTG